MLSRSTKSASSKLSIPTARLLTILASIIEGLHFIIVVSFLVVHGSVCDGTDRYVADLQDLSGACEELAWRILEHARSRWLCP